MKLKFFELARRTSFKSPSKFKLGCIITNKNRVISFGFNQMHKTHPKFPTHSNTIHAELHCLIGLPYEETKGSTCYVYREAFNGNLANSRPCPVCYTALKHAGVKEICYSTREGYKSEKI